MAQYNLADQFPELALGVLTPDFCHAFYDDDEDSSAAGGPIMNVWLGPAGTVSPLHRDPAHRQLCIVKEILSSLPESHGRVR